MKQLIIVPLCLCLLLLLPIAPAPAGESETLYPEEIAAHLQARYDAMESLTFQFDQETQGEMTGRPRHGSGRAVFLKGEGTGRMRWDYSRPDLQVLVSDGEYFRMYFAELNQMVVTPAVNLNQELTYTFFTGKGILQNDFYIRPADIEYQPEDDKLDMVIKLIPKIAHSQVQDIHLWVTADFLIRRFSIRDHFGTITVLNLSDIQADGLEQANPAELAALFSFTPPDGTEIIQQ